MNLRKLRIGLLLYAAFDLFLGGYCGGFLSLTPMMAAQFTQVSGTVTDPNGLAYANGTITAALVSSSTPIFTATNQSYSPPTGPVGLSAAGAFVMQLADVTALTPSGSTYTFTVCSALGTIQPSEGNGPVCFTALGVTISGASQNITSTLVALAPALSQVAALTNTGPSLVSTVTTGYGWDVRAPGFAGGAKLNGTGIHCVTGPGCADDAPAIAACLTAYHWCVIPAIVNGGTTHVRWGSPQVLMTAASGGTFRLSCAGANNNGFTNNTGIVSIDVDMPFSAGGTPGPAIMLGNPQQAPFDGPVIDASCRAQDITGGHTSPGWISGLNISNARINGGADKFSLGPLAATTNPAATAAIACNAGGGGTINSASFPVTIQYSAISPQYGEGPSTAALSVSAAQANASGTNNSCNYLAPGSIDAKAVAVQIFINGFQAGLPYVCSNAVCPMTQDFEYGSPPVTSTINTAFPTAGNGPDVLDHTPASAIYLQGTAGFNCTVRTSSACSANQFSNQPHFFQFECDNDYYCLNFDQKVAGPQITELHCNLNTNGKTCVISESGLVMTAGHPEGGAQANNPIDMQLTGNSSSNISNVFSESGASSATGVQCTACVKDMFLGVTYGNTMATGFADDSNSTNNILICNDFVGGQVITAQPTDYVLCTSGLYNTIPSTRYTTLSGATATSIANTTMLGAAQVGAGTTFWRISFYALQIGAGASCTGNTEIVANINFVDPVAAGAFTVPVSAFIIPTNGTANSPIPPASSGAAPATVVSAGGGYIFQNKASNAIKYSTTVTAGTACSPAPTYKILPILELL